MTSARSRGPAGRSTGRRPVARGRAGRAREERARSVLRRGARRPKAASPPEDAAHPPRALLAGASVAVGAGTALTVEQGFALHLAGYVLASFVTIGLMTLYKWVDVRRRLDPRYLRSPSLDRLVPFVTLLGVGVAAAHVWAIATELAS